MFFKQNELKLAILSIPVIYSIKGFTKSVNRLKGNIKKKDYSLIFRYNSSTIYKETLM